MQHFLSIQREKQVPSCTSDRLPHHSFHLIKSIISFFSFLIFLTFLLSGCSEDTAGRNRTEGRDGGGRGDAENAAAIPVQVVPVKKGDISLYLMQTTTIEAERQVDILAKVAGQVVKLPAEEGIRVRKGDLLAQLDEAELQINFIQTKIGMETDKAMLDRAEKMLEKKLVAEENFETTRLQYESSKATHEAARLQLEHTSVRSPIDGIVISRNIELGQRVNVNEVLFQVADFDPLRAKIYVPEKDMWRIFEGQVAEISIEAQPGLKFPGRVRMVSPVVDPASGTSKVTIDIQDEQRKLKPGMFASVFITTDVHRNTLLAPKKALLIESDLDQVYIYREGKAHKVTLTLDFVSGDNIEVVSGLQEGDLVVTAGQEGLREGLPIRIPEQETRVTPDSIRGKTPKQRPAQE